MASARDIPSFFLIALFPLFIMSLSTLGVAFDRVLYEKEFSRLGVYEKFGQDVARGTNEKVLDYLSGTSGALETPFFTWREKAHLADVRNVLHWLLLIVVVFIAAFIFVFIFTDEKRRFASNVLMIGTLILFGLLCIIGLAILFGFDIAFSLFHAAFFPEGTYLFDASAENIVNLYPEALFQSFARKIVLLASVLGLLGLFGGWCVGQPRKKATKARVGGGRMFNSKRAQ